VGSVEVDVDMKSGKPKKAPKVPKYNMDKNKMEEYDKSSKNEKNGTKPWKNKRFVP
jgi:hemerythrin superfamily protein